MKQSCPLFLCAVLLFFGYSAAPAASVYGVSYTNGNVYLVDTDGGTIALAFSTGVEFLDATDGDNDATFFGTPLGESLYRIDVNAQTATPIGSYGVASIRGLAYNEVTDVLYGTDYTHLYTIDTATGTTTLVGPINRPDAIWAMDYDASIDQIVGVNETDNTMYYISMVDGSATMVGPTGAERVSDLWYDSDSGRMFGVTDQETDLYELNTLTGRATYIATLGGNLTGLGNPAQVPTPVEGSTWGRVKASFR